MDRGKEIPIVISIGNGTVSYDSGTGILSPNNANLDSAADENFVDTGITALEVEALEDFE